MVVLSRFGHSEPPHWEVPLSTTFNFPSQRVRREDPKCIFFLWKDPSASEGSPTKLTFFFATEQNEIEIWEEIVSGAKQ